MATATRRSSRRGDDDVVRLSRVEAGSGRRSAHLPEEENPFEFTIESITRETGRDSGKAYLNVKLKVKSGPRKGKIVYSTCSLKPEALWNLKNMLIAAGLTTLAERDLKVAQIIKAATGKSLFANVADDEYNGKIKSVIDTWEAEVATAPRRRRVEEEDDEEEEDEEVEDDDLEDEDEGEDDLEEDEDEDEEEPAPVKRKSASAKSKTSTKPAVRATAARASRGRSRRASDDDDEDLDDLELDDI